MSVSKMEQQCLIRGKSLRKNGGVVNEDWISELPEALLLHILSSLPTATAITTSVLSKRWKSVWKMLPNLKFDSGCHNPFSESNVSRTLILHKAPVLESLHLKVGYECDASEMELWIGIALARHVRKLVLELRLVKDGPVKFPDALFRFNNTLEILKLDGLEAIFLHLTSPVCLKSLRELHLRHVKFKDEESVSNLLCCCPCLEDLVMKRDYCGVDRVQTFTIAVPSLQRLTIVDTGGGGGRGGYVINSPSLKYLKLKGLYGIEFILIENVPELVEATINKVWKIDNENILPSLTSAKRLSLHLIPSDIKYPSGIIFYQLLSLELCTCQEEWLNLLSLMLNSSPKLQSLKFFYCQRWLNPKCLFSLGSWNWNQPKCVPECLLFHLETFVWDIYEWEREDEIEVATYILKNARCLKKATFVTEIIESHMLKELKKRRKMLKKLTSVVKASDSCHLVCEDDIFGEIF